MRLTFDDCPERAEMAGGRVTVDVVRFNDMPVKRVSHEPGWRWSEHSAPEVGRPRCGDTHVGVLVSGRLGVELADGTAYVAEAGDVLVIAQEHDAWTVGDEPAVLVQFDEGSGAARRFGVERA